MSIFIKVNRMSPLTKSFHFLDPAKMTRYRIQPHFRSFLRNTFQKFVNKFNQLFELGKSSHLPCWVRCKMRSEYSKRYFHQRILILVTEVLSLSSLKQTSETVMDDWRCSFSTQASDRMPSVCQNYRRSVKWAVQQGWQNQTSKLKIWKTYLQQAIIKIILPNIIISEKTKKLL